MGVFDILLIAAILVFTMACLVTDLRTRRIPNWLTVSAFGLGVALHTVGSGLTGLGFSLGGFATGFGVLLVLWFIGGGGGGDVKMMGALGAYLGWWVTILVFITSAVVTVVLMSGVMVFEAFTKRGPEADRAVEQNKNNKKKGAGGQSKKEKRRGRPVPYALPVAISTWIILVMTWRNGTLQGLFLN